MKLMGLPSEACVWRFNLLAAVRQQEGTIGIAQCRGGSGSFCQFQKGEHFGVGCAVRQAIFRGEDVGELIKAERIHDLQALLPASKFSGGNSFSSGISAAPGGWAATNCRAMASIAAIMRFRRHGRDGLDVVTPADEVERVLGLVGERSQVQSLRLRAALGGRTPRTPAAACPCHRRTIPSRRRWLP